MIKELSQFVQTLDPEFKALGASPINGLHIMLHINDFQIGGIMEFGITTRTLKKNPSSEDKEKLEWEEKFLYEKCLPLLQQSWMVDTNKCIDNITKAIHSCSPYCLAIKKDNLIGGKNYNTRKKENKSLVYESLGFYFQKALELIPNENDKILGKQFSEILNNQEKIHFWLNQIPEYKTLSEKEYVIFYLDAVISKYENAYKNYYTDDKLFSKGVPVSVGEEKYGMSSFFNGFPEKKQFLTHKTASFDISERISLGVQRDLIFFKEFVNRKIGKNKVLPTPLPLFIYEDELESMPNNNDSKKESLAKKSIALFKTGAETGEKITYKEIVERLYKDYKNEFGNYYLLYFQGEIKDFDFVSKFVFELRDERTNSDFWQVLNVMRILKKDKEPKSYHRMNNVFDLFGGFVIPILGDKFGNFSNFFDELKEDNYRFKDKDQDLKYDRTYLTVLKYRKAIYDFIYKSRHDLIKSNQFKEILMAGILDDLKYSRDNQLKEKLNIYFSLNHNFDLNNSNFNGFYMPDKLDNLIAKTMKIADTSERVPVVDAYEFAFISGQMIDFLFAQSKSADKSHALLEAFTQKADVELFKSEILKLFIKYKHEIERSESLQHKGRVANLMREIMAFDQPIDVRKLMIFVMAGYFSPSFIYTKKANN